MLEPVLLDAYSTINEVTGTPLLGTCTLVVGDGTTKIAFRNGRAKVPREHARLALKHPHVTIPALDGVEVDEFDVLPVELPVDGLQPDGEITSKPTVDPDEKAALLDAARQHLAEEGEDVPDPDPAPKPGFDAITGDGQPRCQAAKGDGSQCANAAVDGRACGLGKHKEQLSP